MIAGVLFDLDDTLYPQESWLDGAWAAVAKAAPSDAVAPGTLEAALRRVAAKGTDRGAIIDRALAAVGATTTEVGPLVEAFRRHVAPALPCYPGTLAGLRRLRSHVPIGLVTDGDPRIQQDKLRATGLEGAFDVVVYSDELGREHRKPDPLPFRVALRALDLQADDVVYVGDRPDKDVAGGIAAGMRVLRVHTGEYGGLPNVPAAWRRTTDVATALRMLIGELHLPHRAPGG